MAQLGEIGLNCGSGGTDNWPGLDRLSNARGLDERPASK